MAWVLPVLASLLAAFGIVSWLGFRAGASQALRAIHAALTARGIVYKQLDHTGAPIAGEQALANPFLGIALERGDGVRASLVGSNALGAATVPGFGPTVVNNRGLQFNLLVELPLALPNQMICARERAQAVFGPFPPPTVATGHPGFDQRFAVYLPKDDSAGYRSVPADATPWARTPQAVQIFTNLDVLRFEALHVQEGRGRLVFQALAVDGMVAAMEVATAFGRSVPVAPLPRVPLARRGVNAMLLGIMILSGMLMFTLPIQTWALAEEGVELMGYSIACPQGGKFHDVSKRYPASCTGPKGQVLPVNLAGWQAWRYAFFTPLALGLGALMLGARKKHQRDLAREALAGLVRT